MNDNVQATLELEKALDADLGELESKRLKTGRDVADIEAFLERWQGTRFEGPARARLDVLRRSLEQNGGGVRRKMAAGIGAVAVVVVAGYTLWPEGLKSAEAEAAARRSKVLLKLRTANGGDEEKWFAPGKGKSFQDCIDSACTIKGPEMVVVPAGSFQMGTTQSEIDALIKEYRYEAYKNEGPQRKVTIAKPFAVGKYPVTFAEWDTCVANNGCNGYTPSDEGWGRGDRPVINVSWEDAQAYVKWISEKTGKSYRLLSEAEREYAARAGTETPFWWGNSISTHQANYDGNHTYKGGSKGEYRNRTVPVRTFQPNPWGLYQVHGNVYDWVEDCYHENYNKAPTDGSAWTDEKDCYRVLRGSSWNIYPCHLRSANRSWEHLGFRGNWIGFRLART